MNLFELTLLRFLRESKVQMEINGFDMEGFGKAMHRELSDRLDTIQCIILEDSETSSATEKIAAIKRLFDEESTL